MKWSQIGELIVSGTSHAHRVCWTVTYKRAIKLELLFIHLKLTLAQFILLISQDGVQPQNASQKASTLLLSQVHEVSLIV